MSYIEFKNLEPYSHPLYPFIKGFRYNEGHFYIEPWFYTQLKRLEERFPNAIADVISVMLCKVDEHERVIFTGNFEDPLLDENDYIYVELADIMIELGLEVEDKSRGCDYGD